MEVSDNVKSGESQKGQDLLDTVASLTGLPEDLVQQELQDMITVAGQNPGNVTLEELRKAMLLYLEALALQEEGLLDAESDTYLQQASERNVIPSA
jgi:hypothetical protein